MNLFFQVKSFITLLTLSISFIASATDVTPESKAVEHPFSTPNSIKNFQLYIKKLNDKGANIVIPVEFWSIAPQIVYWGYEYKPNDSGGFDVDFIQRFNVKPFIDGYVKAINNFRMDRCSYFNTHNARITLYSWRKMSVIGNISGKVRACDDWLGTTDIGDIDGNVEGSIGFSTKAETQMPASSYSGLFTADEPVISSNAELSTIFGIDAGSVAGQILVGLGNITLANMLFFKNPTIDSYWRSLDVLDVNIYRAPEYTAHPFAYATATNGSVESRKYKDFLKEIINFTWSYQPKYKINDDKSGFLGDANAPTLQIVYSTGTKSKDKEFLIKESINNEIDIIKSFSEDNAFHEVIKGDTLWSISFEKYGSPYYYSMLAAANGIDYKRAGILYTGKRITLPPLYKLYTLEGYYFVSPGDSVTSVCIKHYGNGYRKCIDDVRRLNSGMNPDKIWALQGLKFPIALSTP